MPCVFKTHGITGQALISLAHPLGTLVRQANIEEVYIWLLSEPGIIHRFLEHTNAQVRDTVFAMGESGISGWFGTCA